MYKDLSTVDGVQKVHEHQTYVLEKMLKNDIYIMFNVSSS